MGQNFGKPIIGRDVVPALLLAALVGGWTPCSVQAAQDDPPPVNRTYFVVAVGLTGPFEVGAECFRFTPTAVCTFDGNCGSWSATGESGRETGFVFHYESLADGLVWDGQTRVDSRGARSSIGGVARLQTSSDKINFAFAGRQVAAAQCENLVAAFEARNPIE